MPLKKNVYLNNRSVDALKDVLEESGNLSGRLNSIIDRYGALIDGARRTTLPLFSQNDLEKIREACRSWMTREEPANAILHVLPAKVTDAVQFGRLSQWATSEPQKAKVLLENIQSLHPVQLLTLVEWIEQAEAGQSNTDEQ